MLVKLWQYKTWILILLLGGVIAYFYISKLQLVNTYQQEVQAHEATKTQLALEQSKVIAVSTGLSIKELETSKMTELLSTCRESQRKDQMLTSTIESIMAKDGSSTEANIEEDKSTDIAETPGVSATVVTVSATSAGGTTILPAHDDSVSLATQKRGMEFINELFTNPHDGKYPSHQ